MRSFGVILLSLALPGCALFKDIRNGAGPLPAFTDPRDEQPFNLATDCMPAAQNSDGQCVLPAQASVASNSSYVRISSLTDSTAQILWRNRFQDYLLWRSEKQCQLYKLTIISAQNSVNFGLNTLTTSTAGVAAIVVAPAANILGAIAAMSNGIRSHFNEDLYQRMIAPAIVSQINVIRNGQYTTIMNKRRDKGTDVPIQTYTLEEAIGDAERYHELCSSSLALAALLGDKKQFDDTADGIEARIKKLQSQADDNNAAIARLKPLNDAAPEPKPYTATIQQYVDANNDIAKQISILQRQMLTAPSHPGT
jgi:hypothetical protein